MSNKHTYRVMCSFYFGHKSLHCSYFTCTFMTWINTCIHKHNHSRVQRPISHSVRQSQEEPRLPKLTDWIKVTLTSRQQLYSSLLMNSSLTPLQISKLSQLLHRSLNITRPQLVMCTQERRSYGVSHAPKYIKTLTEG